jgi:hypothetical protein
LNVGVGESLGNGRHDAKSRPGAAFEIRHHPVQQTFFLYVYELGGDRVEVANAGARLILAPDWKPIRWTEDERKKGQAWGLN